MFFDKFLGAGSATPDVPSPTEPRRLVLYKRDSCGFCHLVYRKLDELGLTVDMRDTSTNPGAREELRAATGRTQVPCLFIDDVPLLESLDINEWLEQYAAHRAA